MGGGQRGRHRALSSRGPVVLQWLSGILDQRRLMFLIKGKLIRGPLSSWRVGSCWCHAAALAVAGATPLHESVREVDLALSSDSGHGAVEGRRSKHRVASRGPTMGVAAAESARTSARVVGAERCSGIGSAGTHATGGPDSGRSRRRRSARTGSPLGPPRVRVVEHLQRQQHHHGVGARCDCGSGVLLCAHPQLQRQGGTEVGDPGQRAPPGIELAWDGRLFGTPTTAGRFSFRVLLSLTSRDWGATVYPSGSDNRAYTFTVRP